VSRKKGRATQEDPAALLARLEGRWRLARRVAEDGGGTALFEGWAAFRPGGDGVLDYAETGWLRLADAPPMRAERRYAWRAQGGRVFVSFADGRPFHDFAPADPRARHLCGADVYDVAYRFDATDDGANDGADAWEAEWRVRGPRKAYVMVTRYCR